MSTLSTIVAFARPRAGLALAAIACGAVGVATTIAFAFLLGPLASLLIAREDAALGPLAALGSGEARLATLAAALLAVVVARALAAYGQQSLTSRFGASVSDDLRRRMYAHLLGTPPGSWTYRRQGEIAARITHDAAHVERLVAYTATVLVFQGLTFVGLVSFAVSIDPVLGAVALVGLPPIGVVVYWNNRRARAAHGRSHEQLGHVSGAAAELASAAPVVVAYGAEDLAERAFAAASATLRDAHARAQQVSASGGPWVRLLGAVAIAITLAVAHQRVVAGTLSTQDFVSFFAALFLLYGPVQSMGASVGSLAGGLAAQARIDELLALRTEARDEGRALPRMREGLTLRDVSFAYREGEPVLDGLDLSLEAGTSLAIVGSSGQGKSTLVAIMLGLLRADRGDVRIDGVSLEAASLRSWRAQFAWVTQDPLLFADTLLANVALSDSTPDRARAEDALRRAGASELLERLSLDGRIAEAGRDLSGGQRQRICIARALYRDAPVLVFDEATSSLDGPTEGAIAATIESLLGDKTVIVVSHRWSTIRRADRVVVLEGGRIVESGAPRELRERGGRFGELFASASLGPV
ncbi:MAG: ABC transporter ATP-binding protein [Sandaracinaceae bacterium]